MKKVFLGLLMSLWLVAISGAAAVVTPAEARQAALSLMSDSTANSAHPMSTEGTEPSCRPLLDHDESRLLAYVIEPASTGYVVVPADTHLPPIIAYSSTNRFRWDDGIDNILLAVLRTDLALRLDAVDRGLISEEVRLAREEAWAQALAVPAGATATASAMVGPLLEFPTWAQVAPWNQLCPVDPSTQASSVTGCVATALAQILAYWDYPASVRFGEGDSYTTGMKGIYIDARQASIDLIDYGAIDHYNPSDEAMAQLSYAAGVSVRMDYSSNGSGAYAIDLAVALAGGPAPVQRQVRPGVWRYETADIRTYALPQWGAPFYQTATQFFETLRTDLIEGRPSVLCVTTGNPYGGHTLICDGYEPSTDRYHLNLGWGGYSDGWYALPTDMPPGYSIIEYGIFNISPPPQPAEPEEPPVQLAGGDPVEPADGMFFAGPNPFADLVYFTYRGTAAPSTLAVRVFTLSGDLVWGDEAYGADRIPWSGGGALEPLANGTYLYVIFATVDGHVLKGRGTLTLIR